MKSIGFLNKKNRISEKPTRQDMKSVMAGRHLGSSSVLCHDIQNVFKQNAAICFLGFVVFIILFPISTSAVQDISVFNVDYTHQQLKFRFCAEEALLLIQSAAVIMGGILGINLFSFTTDKNKTAFYMSVGLKKAKLFFVRTFSGLAVLFICIAVPVMISMLVNYKALGLYEGLIAYGCHVAAGLILQAFIIMMISSAACFIAGTFAEVNALWISIVAAPYILLYFSSAVVKGFLWGNTFGEKTYALETIDDALTEKLAYLNPAAFFYTDLKKYYAFNREMQSGGVPEVEHKLIIGWIIAAILIVTIVYILFYRRRSENAGISGLSIFYEYFLMLIWPIAVFAVTLNGLSGIGCGTAAAAAFIAMLLSGAVVLFVTGHDSIGRIVHKAGCCVLCAVIAGICMVAVNMGGFGFSERVPQTEAIVSASVSYTGQPAFATSQAAGSGSGSSYYFDAPAVFFDEEGKEKVRKIHSQFAENGFRDFGTPASGIFSETVVPYDIHIEYELKSGRVFKRYYDRTSLKELALILELEDSDEFKESLSSVITGESAGYLWNSAAFAEGSIYITDSWFGNVSEIRFSSEKRGELLNALAADISAQDVNDRYFPEKDADMVLFFTLNGESDLKAFSHSMSNVSIYLTDEYVNTRRLLSEWNADEAGSGSVVSVYDVESIMLQRFDPYGSMNKISDPVSMLFLSYKSVTDMEFILQQDFGNRPVLKSEEQISELLPGLRSTYFMSGGGYLAAIKLQGRSEYIYKFLPYEYAPDFVNKKMN